MTLMVSWTKGGLGKEPPSLGGLGEFTTKIIHFRHVFDEILPKNF